MSVPHGGYLDDDRSVSTQRFRAVGLARRLLRRKRTSNGTLFRKAHRTALDQKVFVRKPTRSSASRCRRGQDAAAHVIAVQSYRSTALEPLPFSRKGSLVQQKITTIALASAVLSGVAFTPVIAAEREQVRAVINLIAAVKMPFPERFERDVARTEYVRLDGGGEMVACLRVDDKVRWCYEHIPALGSRTEMLRIRNEPVEGIQVGQLFHYVVDYDLDGLTDVGSTTRMELPAHAPVATVIQFFVRGTGRGDQFRTEYEKLYDDGIQVALKYLGE